MWIWIFCIWSLRRGQSVSIFPQYLFILFHYCFYTKIAQFIFRGPLTQKVQRQREISARTPRLAAGVSTIHTPKSSRMKSLIHSKYPIGCIPGNTQFIWLTDVPAQMTNFQSARKAILTNRFYSPRVFFLYGIRRRNCHDKYSAVIILSEK